jgi:hypothetical protein
VSKKFNPSERLVARRMPARAVRFTTVQISSVLQSLHGDVTRALLATQATSEARHNVEPPRSTAVNFHSGYIRLPQEH